MGGCGSGGGTSRQTGRRDELRINLHNTNGMKRKIKYQTKNRYLDKLYGAES